MMRKGKVRHGEQSKGKEKEGLPETGGLSLFPNRSQFEPFPPDATLFCTIVLNCEMIL